MELSDVDRQLLEFEARSPRRPGIKEDAIRQQLGLTPMRYYYRLDRLIDSPAALREYPQLVNRLARLRDRGLVGFDDGRAGASS